MMPKGDGSMFARLCTFVVLMLMVSACGSGSQSSRNSENLSQDSGGGARETSPSNEACHSCGILLNAELPLPRGAAPGVAEVTTDGNCAASYSDGRIVVGSTGLAHSCVVTVRLSDGSILSATVLFKTYDGTCCPFGSAIDASPLTYVDGGAD